MGRNGFAGLARQIMRLSRVGWRGCGVAAYAVGPAAPARDFCWQNYSIKEEDFDRFCLLRSMKKKPASPCGPVFAERKKSAVTGALRACLPPVFIL
jgi:hypothetical protein